MKLAKIFISLHMDSSTRQLVDEIFGKIDARFGSTWQIPWKKVVQLKKEMDGYVDRYPNVDWKQGGGLIQLCRPGAVDYLNAYKDLAVREVLIRKLTEKRSVYNLPH